MALCKRSLILMFESLDFNHNTELIADSLIAAVNYTFTSNPGTLYLRIYADDVQHLMKQLIIAGRLITTASEKACNQIANGTLQWKINLMFESLNFNYNTE